MASLRVFDATQKDLAPVDQSELRLRRQQAEVSVDVWENHDFTLGVKGGDR